MKISHIIIAAVLALAAGGAHASKNEETDDIFKLYEKAPCTTGSDIWSAMDERVCHAFSKAYLIQHGREKLLLHTIRVCASGNLLPVEQCTEAERAVAQLMKEGRMTKEGKIVKNKVVTK